MSELKLFRVMQHWRGESSPRKTRHVYPEDKAMKKRNSLQAYFSNKFGDGMVRVFIQPETPNPVQPELYQDQFQGGTK